MITVLVIIRCLVLFPRLTFSSCQVSASSSSSLSEATMKAGFDSEPHFLFPWAGSYLTNLNLSS